MATVYRLPGDTDDEVSVVIEGDTKPAATGGMVPHMVQADGTMGPITGTEIVGGLTIPPHNLITLVQNTLQDIYVYRKDGVIVATVTITFTNSTKNTTSTIFSGTTTSTTTSTSTTTTVT